MTSWPRTTHALVAHGVDAYSPEECWDDYRTGLFQGPLITVLGAMYATRTERGDEMFVTMTDRCCRAIRDADALALALTCAESRP